MLKYCVSIMLSLLCAGALWAQPVNEQIMGKGTMTAEQLEAFFVKYNPDGDVQKASRLAKMYIEEADIEGVNHDVAFAQMILETGWLRFQGLVKPEMNNFCGIGATGEKRTGHYFKSEQEGVRAHVQHLKAYASKDSLRNPVIDPRYEYVSPKGKSPTVSGLSGTWAADKTYAAKIKSVLQRMQLVINN